MIAIVLTMNPCVPYPPTLVYAAFLFEMLCSNLPFCIILLFAASVADGQLCLKLLPGKLQNRLISFK